MRRSRVRPSLSARLAATVSAALLALAIAAPMSAPAAEAAPCGTLRVGLKEYPGVVEVRGSDAAARAFAGLDRDFYEALAARTGCRFAFELESQPRIWARLRNGTLDLTSWAIPTEERRDAVVVAALVTVRPMAVTWASAGVGSQAAFVDDPKLRAVAVRAGSYGAGYDELLASLRARGRVVEEVAVDDAVHALLNRRVDLLVTYPWVLAGLPADQRARLRVQDWHPEAAGVPSGLAMSRRTVDDATRARLVEGLRALQRDGTLARLAARHLGNAGVTVLPAVTPQ